MGECFLTEHLTVVKTFGKIWASVLVFSRIRPFFISYPTLWFKEPTLT